MHPETCRFPQGITNQRSRPSWSRRFAKSPLFQFIVSDVVRLLVCKEEDQVLESEARQLNRTARSLLSNSNAEICLASLLLEVAFCQVLHAIRCTNRFPKIATA